jgi:hypothetical protein
MRHAPGWLSLGPAAIAALVLCLNALGQAREHARLSGSSAVACSCLAGQHPFCAASMVKIPRRT